jgi:hypothetical protein
MRRWGKVALEISGFLKIVWLSVLDFLSSFNILKGVSL